MSEEFYKINRLTPYIFNIVNELKILARKNGDDIIDFGMGNPDQKTPDHIINKMQECANKDNVHRYSTSKGIPRLRKAISNWYEEKYSVNIDPEEEAIVTIGSKEGLAHLALATLNQGDSVIVPSPAYPIHPYGAVIAGAEIIYINVQDDSESFFKSLDDSDRQLKLSKIIFFFKGSEEKNDGPIKMLVQKKFEAKKCFWFRKKFGVKKFGSEIFLFVRGHL